MFESVGWGELLVLVVAGLFILGPERLPEAAAWLGRTIRQVKGFAAGAREQLRGEFGPEFDELRKPLDELRGLRNFNPGNVVRRTLFDDDPPVKPNGYAPPPRGGGVDDSVPRHPAAGASGPAPQQPLAPNERPPLDPDAT
ncbi:MAG: Sec-independent protein translocase protein TatB [Pseudonocardia sp.]